MVGGVAAGQPEQDDGGCKGDRCTNAVPVDSGRE